MSAPPVPKVLTGVVVRSRRERFSVVVPRRALVVGVGLLAVFVVVGVVTLSTGSAAVPLADVVASLTGSGSRAVDFVVLTLRLPRLVLALLVGAALGVAGALFQSLSRNPLGSPDIIGFTTGCATGAIVVMLLLGWNGFAIPIGAVVGGVLTALVVYALAYRRGMQGFRLVLVGIGMSSLLVSINSFLLSRAPEREAERASRWLVGTLNTADWSMVLTVLATLVVLGPVLAWMVKPMAMLEMGDEAAAARGVRGEPVRLALVVVGILLTAVAITATGPIAFIALAAPQMARRLVRAGGPCLVTSALVGGVLLAASDLAAERLLPVRVPVGVTTAAVGGLYLAWLLTREWRRGRS